MLGIDYDTAILVSNSAIAASCFGLVYIFTTALWKARDQWRWFRYREDTAAAIAKIVIFTAGGISRTSATILIELRMAGADTTWYENHIHANVTLYTGVVFVVGAACLVRVYSESNKEWLALSVFTLAAVALILLT
jgi:hypothetical protein